MRSSKHRVVRAIRRLADIRESERPDRAGPPSETEKRAMSDAVEAIAGAGTIDESAKPDWGLLADPPELRSWATDISRQADEEDRNRRLSIQAYDQTEEDRKKRLSKKPTMSDAVAAGTKAVLASADVADGVGTDANAASLHREAAKTYRSVGTETSERMALRHDKDAEFHESKTAKSVYPKADEDRLRGLIKSGSFVDHAGDVNGPSKRSIVLLINTGIPGLENVVVTESSDDFNYEGFGQEDLARSEFGKRKAEILEEESAEVADIEQALIAAIDYMNDGESLRSDGSFVFFGGQKYPLDDLRKIASKKGTSITVRDDPEESGWSFVHADKSSGPGKFEASGSIGERLYAIAMDHTDDQANDADHWYGLILESGVEGAEHVILSEDSQGFVEYTTYPTSKIARNTFDHIVEDIEGEELLDSIIQKHSGS